MKVRMSITISGTRDGADWPAAGEILEVSDSEGADLCAAGMATPVVQDRAERRPAKKPESRKG